MIDQNAYLQSLQSPNSLMGQRVVAFSEELNSVYRPNFKKLKAKRKQYQSSTHLQMKEIFSVKSLQKIIMQQCQQKNCHCGLCECNYAEDEMFSLCKMNHTFCQNCLIEYVSYKIGVMEQLRCPDEYCNGKAYLQGEIFQKIPEQLKKRYHRAQLWRQTLSNPDLKLCPKQICDGQIDMKQSPHMCNMCRRQFCSQCMMEKHNGNCDTIYESTHKEWRRCPTCRMFIAKIQGCNHIRCRCACEFCFVCLQKWDNSHYNCMQKMQMVYFDVDEVKCKLLIAIAMMILMPVLMVLSAIVIAACFVVMIPVGFVMGLGLTIVKFIHLLCFVFILLPIGGAVGALAFPFYFTFGHIFPYFVHQFRRYKITLQQLFVNASQNSK